MMAETTVRAARVRDLILLVLASSGLTVAVLLLVLWLRIRNLVQAAMKGQALTIVAVSLLIAIAAGVTYVLLPPACPPGSEGRIKVREEG